MTDPYPTGPVVYILRNGKSLYVGATIDLSHRIRQHNGELSGGAHRTSTKGPGWICLLYVQGFQSRTESLQFELQSFSRDNIDFDRIGFFNFTYYFEYKWTLFGYIGTLAHPHCCFRTGHADQPWASTLSGTAACQCISRTAPGRQANDHHFTY